MSHTGSSSSSMMMMLSSETRFLDEKKKKKMLQNLTSNTLLPVLAELHPLLLLDEKRKGANDDTVVNVKLLQRYLDRGNHRNQNNNIISSGQEDNPPLSDDDDTPSKETLTIKTRLQELIVVLGQLLLSKEEDSSAPPSQVLEEGILQMIKDLNRLIGEQIDQCMEQWKEENPLLRHPSERPEDDDEMEAVHLRREIVEGLQQPAKGMYGLLVDRLSISREEWFHTFGAPAEEFTFGVWTLIACGLLQAKPSRRCVVYEKISVVWC
jgi:hypothetical protein